MPNTPALIGEGVMALYFSSGIQISDKEDILTLLKGSSKLFVFDQEEKIDIITGFSGSGPAYVFEFANLMIKEMESMGIDSKTSNEMIKQTFKGASLLMSDSDKTPKELREAVTSKGGVTKEALDVFDEFKMGEIFKKAIQSAYNKAKELSQ